MVPADDGDTHTHTHKVSSTVTLLHVHRALIMTVTVYNIAFFVFTIQDDETLLQQRKVKISIDDFLCPAPLP